MTKFKINSLLLPMKGHYFLYNGGTAPVVPFMPVFAKQLGFSSVVVGTLYTVLPIAGMVAKPLFGGLADRLKWHKKLFMFFLALTGILFFLINFTPNANEGKVGPGVDLDCGAVTLFKTCNVTDNCALTRLLVYAGNGTVDCHIDCPEVVGSEWNEELCKQWGLSQYCKSNADHPMVFDAKVPLAHTEQIENCIYFRVQTAIFEEKSVIPYCNAQISTSNCHVTCKEPVVNEVLHVRTEEASAKSWSFIYFAFLMLTSWISMAVVVSIGDAICFELLGSKPANYGKQRVWGSVGWGIFSVLAGFLVDEFSQGRTEKDYSVVFYMCLIILSVDFLFCTRLKVSHTQMSASIVHDIGRLLSQLRINIFLLWCITVGLSTGLLWGFLFWHLEELAAAQGCSSLEWIKTLEGLVMGVQCFGGELPFFFISSWVLKKIGHIHAMSMVLFGFGLRFFLYFWLVDPWWVLPIELLNGVTFGIFYATMASYASKIAPPGTEATVQGLVGAVFEGIGVSLGSLIGGLMFQKIGGANTFLAFSIMSWVLFCLHVVVQFFMQRATPNEWQQQQEEVKELPEGEN
ncbi:major facilitator superfamily domain-containing protein 6-A isoform X2 [Neocloeon triangulifer]|uniref:major facilitator superfamily domain-containing protein 6-A isoform X2 n=1 Tax=Neocloeon triangulifer TaxID=2078957 RepID=UPI00286F715D|nr:major facilitator superfamily domain-containing protein 6-A isoform X2 [Neocloeon triangulifer]XP_059489345.1 major facilitator superfamily domain-containing protein 6-A isoform X2 [Neocloeon triangulifer]